MYFKQNENKQVLSV